MGTSEPLPQKMGGALIKLLGRDLDNFITSTLELLIDLAFPGCIPQLSNYFSSFHRIPSDDPNLLYSSCTIGKAVNFFGSEEILQISDRMLEVPPPTGRTTSVPPEICG